MHLRPHTQGAQSSENRTVQVVARVRRPKGKACADVYLPLAQSAPPVLRHIISAQLCVVQLGCVTMQCYWQSGLCLHGDIGPGVWLVCAALYLPPSDQ